MDIYGMCVYSSTLPIFKLGEAPGWRSQAIVITKMKEYKNIFKYFKIYKVSYNRCLRIIGLFSGEKNNIFKRMGQSSDIIIIILNITTKK